MLPLFGKLCPSVRQAFLFSGSIIRVLRQTFRSSGSIVRVLDRPSATQEASSEYSDRPSATQEASSEHPTALPQPRKHRPSYSRLMTSAGFSWAARQTRQLILNPTTNNKTRKTPNAGAIGIGIWRV